MTGERELLRVLDARQRRQIVLPCPGCRRLIGLQLCVLPPGEYRRRHPATDLTASLLPPGERATAMKREAENAEKSSAVPWMTCTFCGYDDHYVFGADAGVPDDALRAAAAGTARASKAAGA